MSTIIQIGYVPGDTFVHRLDPRTKFSLFLWSSIFNYVFYDLYISLASLIPLVLLSFIGKVGKQIFKIIALVVIPLFAFTTLLLGMLIPYGFPQNKTSLLIFNVLGREVVWYLEGTVYGAVWSLRLAITMCGALLFYLTSHPGRITSVLLKSRIPYKYVYVLIAVFQFIPIMLSEVQTIYQAQLSRGLNVNVGLFKRLKNFFVLMIPLTLGSINRIQLRSIALESRGFSAPVRKSIILESDLTKSDYLTMATMAGLTALFIYLIMTIGLVPFMKGIEYVHPGG